MPYRENEYEAPVEVAPLPFTMRALGAIKRTLTSTAFCWLALSIPLVLAFSYVDGAALKFVLMRLALAIAVIPGGVLLVRGFKAFI